MVLHVLQFSFYLIKLRILRQKVSLIIYCIANFSFSLQLYERYFIDSLKLINFILISGIVCQLSDVNYGHPLSNVTNKQKVNFLLKTRQKFENRVNAYQLILKFK